MKKRIISSVIGIPIMLLLIFNGPMLINIGWIAIVAILITELHNMVFGRLELTTYIPSIAYLVGSFWFTYSDTRAYGLLITFYLIFTLITNIIIIRKNSLNKIALSMVGTLYIVNLSSYMILIAQEKLSIILVSFVLAWSYDTCAYLAGVRWGKRRPWPNLSPKKSIEGVIGGTIGSTAITVTYAYFNNWSLITAVFFALVGIVLAQCGDLIESSFKRTCEVKDSGKILPGHGGLFDRFDSILPVIPWTFVIFVLFKLQ